jgi:hypothetical protein
MAVPTRAVEGKTPLRSVERVAPRGRQMPLHHVRRGDQAGSTRRRGRAPGRERSSALGGAARQAHRGKSRPAKEVVRQGSRRRRKVEPRALSYVRGTGRPSAWPGQGGSDRPARGHRLLPVDHGLADTCALLGGLPVLASEVPGNFTRRSGERRRLRERPRDHTYHSVPLALVQDCGLA